MSAQHQKRTSLRAIAILMPVLCSAVVATQCNSRVTQGQTFTSPEEAAQALVAAAKGDDAATVLKVLGSSARDIVVTNDPVNDRNERKLFAERAATRMQIVPVPDNTARRMIVVGEEEWPFPIPLVESNAKWQFDSNDGYDELVLRRIGGNEITALEVCRGFVEAEYEYASLNGDPRVTEFAKKFFSTPGKRDGLYWKSDNPNDKSPVAEIIAKAEAEGYKNKSDPYHGYHFKVLTAQGPKAPGGARSYLDNGSLTGGFALIAYPSDYGTTGVMTFEVNQAGIIFQKDLGEKTTAIAAATTEYNPDNTWRTVPASNIPGDDSVAANNPIR